MIVCLREPLSVGQNAQLVKAELFQKYCRLHERGRRPTTVGIQRI